LDTLTASIHALMREAAAQAIVPRYQKLAGDEVSTKANADDFVTVADHHAEAILTEGLARLLPEAAVVGEEAAFAAPQLLERAWDGLCWLVDPLDGTHNFSHGKPPFGILVALVEGGETIGGWIYDVLSERFCHARRGEGAFIGGEPFRARPSGREPPIAAISLVYMNPARREAVKRHVAPLYTLVDIPRCAAEQYPRLALGQNDVSIFERTLPWDHAAGVLFLNEAGGMAARPDGTPYRVDDHARLGLVGAASPALWEELAERLAGLDEALPPTGAATDGAD
jgi:fructose-1,6-bisphosphatase/inositol monophosphatase family enzyme